MRRWLGLGVATAVLLAPSSGAAELPSTTADDARIVFVSTRASAEVFVMEADGTGEAPITHRNPVASEPAWSPDGDQIAFTGFSDISSNPPSVRLWVMGRDGDNPRPLGPRGSAEVFFGPAPDWSPNGRRVVYSLNYDIFIVKRDGTERRRLTRGGSKDDGEPAWSPSGRWIAFSRNGGIYRIRPNGTKLRLLGSGDEADWSPSGRSLVFAVSNSNGRRDIYTMRADGTDRRRLTSTRADESSPAWSPGGGRIAFTRGRRSIFVRAIWVMNRDGSGAHRVRGNGAGPSWSPKGGFMAFSRGRMYDDEGFEDFAKAIHTMRANGGPVVRLLTPEFDRDVDASPDGTRIAYTSVRPFSTSGVYVADADGANEMFLHAGKGPDWSPDGSRILLQSGDGLVVVDQDGSDPTALPEPVGHDFSFLSAWRWHPDGARVSFVSTGTTPCSDVYAMELDGTQVTRMTHADCFPVVWDFDWHPSGASLVFSGLTCEDCDANKIFSADVPDGAPTALTTGPDNGDYRPRISPDGTEIVFFRPADVGERTVWSMHLDGSAETQLTASRADHSPAWLPVPGP